MNPLSNIVTDITFNIEGDVAHIYTDKFEFMVPVSGLEHLKYGLEAHYSQTRELLTCSDEDLSIYGKQRPRRDSREEINYQIDRKGYNGQLIKASSLISRLPLFSQSRNRNGKQNIATRRWKLAISEENEDVLALIEYYKQEEEYIRSTFPSVNWTKGTFAISPCHIYPAKRDRGEDSWTPDKILRDLSLVNKAFDKISSSDLQGVHATSNHLAQIAVDYIEEFDWDELSITRQALYLILKRRIANGFYEDYKITDTDLNLN